MYIICVYVVYMQWAGTALYFVVYRELGLAGSCCTCTHILSNVYNLYDSSK